MIYLKNIYEQWRTLYGARHEPESLRPMAEAYWRALLVAAALGVCGILAYGASEFVSVLDALSSGVSTGGNPPALLDRQQLETTLRAFDARATLSNSAQTGFVVADPSK